MRWRQYFLAVFGLLGKKYVLVITAPRPGNEDERLSADLPELYLQTVLGTLTGDIAQTPNYEPPGPYDADERNSGTGWCSYCFTMAGTSRVKHVGELCLDAWRRGVKGDVLEAGVWKGGIGIYVAAVMRAYPELAGRSRIVLADTFHNIPVRSSSASDTYWEELGRGHVSWSSLEFDNPGRDGVEASFRRFGLFSESRVQFVQGPFSATMAPLRQSYLASNRGLSVLRVDADMYESYLDVLYQMYDTLSIGGYYICDDCGCVLEADRAIAGFRQHQRIYETIELIPDTACGIFWQKRTNTTLDIAAYEQWRDVRARIAGNFDAYANSAAFEELIVLASFEATIFQSPQTVQEACDHSETVFILVAPLSASLPSIGHDDSVWIANMGEALNPSRFCARVVAIDTAKPFPGGEAALDVFLDEMEVTTYVNELHGWRIGFGVACAPALAETRRKLLGVLDYASKATPGRTGIRAVDQHHQMLRGWALQTCGAAR